MLGLVPLLDSIENSLLQGPRTIEKGKGRFVGYNANSYFKDF